MNSSTDPCLDTKRKIEQSLALLNSLLAHPAKKQTLGQHHASSTTTLFSEKTSTAPLTQRKSDYLPPRPAVLDKLAQLSSARPTLNDSIAASIAASASTSRVVAAEAPTAPTTDTKSLASTTTTTSRRHQRYLPWSREQFHERLQTFKPSTWFDKPKMVNPVECAKRGWINKGPDRLECCGGCGGVVVVRIDNIPSLTEQQHVQHGEDGSTLELQSSSGDDVDADEEAMLDFNIEALGPKFHAMLSSNHADACPWKVHPCDDGIYRFPVVSQSQAREDLTKRVESLQLMVGNPLIDKICHPLSSEQLQHLTTVIPDEGNTKLLILALFGWNTLETQKILVCQACHSQCTFIPTHRSRHSGGNDELDHVEEDDDDDTGFDVVQSHRWYCYWVDPGQDHKQKEGWKILYEILTSTLGISRQKTQDTATAEPESAVPHLGPSEALAQVRRILRGQDCSDVKPPQQ
ncbi:C3HC zinc finger-like-domain-containing protein [Mortierella sp. GBAus27b]|nr:C3HC zinc finger-like-domain-containing protein [Mortierella sp. GBAus27b]